MRSHVFILASALSGFTVAAPLQNSKLITRQPSVNLVLTKSLPDIVNAVDSFDSALQDIGEQGSGDQVVAALSNISKLVATAVEDVTATAEFPVNDLMELGKQAKNLKNAVHKLGNDIETKQGQLDTLGVTQPAIDALTATKKSSEELADVLVNKLPGFAESIVRMGFKDINGEIKRSIDLLSGTAVSKSDTNQEEDGPARGRFRDSIFDNLGEVGNFLGNIGQGASGIVDLISAFGKRDAEVAELLGKLAKRGGNANNEEVRAKLLSGLDDLASDPRSANLNLGDAEKLGRLKEMIPSLLSSVNDIDLGNLDFPSLIGALLGSSANGAAPSLEGKPASSGAVYETPAAA